MIFQEHLKKFHPIEIGDVVVRAAWSDEEFPDKIIINIEPRMAFGTGRHETTKLCIEAVRRSVKTGDRVLDVGSGSGILSILAAKLGAVEVFGLDIDTAAVDNARENAAMNNVDITFEIGSVGLKSPKYPRKSPSLSHLHYDVVVANLNRDCIVDLFDDLVRATRPGGVLILSGITRDQVDEMSGFFEGKGYADFEIATMGEWVCYVMVCKV